MTRTPVHIPGSLGHFGYREIVPGTEYAAVSVHAPWCGRDGLAPGSWAYTDIKHIGDDPLWTALPETGEDGPDNRKINAIHRAPYRQMAALTREAGPHLLDPIRDAGDAENRKFLRKAMRELPDWHSITLIGRTMGVNREGGTQNYFISESPGDSA